MYVHVTTYICRVECRQQATDVEPLRIFMQLAIESARQEMNFGCLRFTILFDIFYAWR